MIVSLQAKFKEPTQKCHQEKIRAKDAMFEHLLYIEYLHPLYLVDKKTQADYFRAIEGFYAIEYVL